ncbi:VirD4-like conjugal transfer protein, CD1115 family [Bacillus cereus]|uniref:Conjugal transfer protein TraG n=2 Tax=Bacillus cereus TaxID=1396 RepID=A0A9X6GF60_BACCE|nr:type IV secretory system conjugative DNA transfer family protein [Bacillus cereus]MCQ6287852.1 type IV secretory system conjugative DNA transfer family protein [Bacillus cereus]MCQ6315975.1 type IV secretory system conjugative DNA transfer family protein [Bacillus cereus]MCQ6327851.1 type IV secretory system conjugative DNA transfer family protein [Bacillus cereus]MCQ6384903.1 type IV secretory system conjugative DNA transfer family protein [Bacillus cereus]OOR74189.1 conjugal transfer prot
MRKIKENKIYVILGVMVFLFLNYLFYYFRVTFAGNEGIAIEYLFSEPQYLLYAFPLSFHTIDLFVPLFLVGFAVFVIRDKKKNKKKYKKGVEHGSAQWGNVEKDLKDMYDEEDQYNNILFSQHTKIRLDDKNAPFKVRRNKNVLIIGGSGSGKTRFMVKPNMLQMNASFVVTDPKGTIVNEIGMALKNIGKYKIKVFNTVKFNKSMRYNPLAYVYNEQDILKLVNTIIVNTEGEGAKKGEDFWVKAERLLYQAYLSLIVSKFPKEEQHLGTLMDLLSYSTVKEDDENYKNPLDYMFAQLEKEDPTHFAVKQYQLYKLAAGKTAKSILISCGARLAPLNIPALRDLLSKDELNLDTLGNKGRKTALFIVVPDTDETFNFIVAIMYAQLFNMLCTIADDRYKGELPTHVRFILDEFANIGKIPNFEKLIATIRSRNISATIILQAFAQLKDIYKEKANIIDGNCDTSIFLGSKEKTTIKSLSEELGKETINDYNESKTRSNNDSFGQNYSKLGRALMTQDELLTMERDECIVQILGKKPFKDKKYDITKHPRYKFHSQGEKYWFDINKYLEALRTPREPILILTTVNGSREI